MIPLSNDLEGFLLGVVDYLQLYVGQFSRHVLDNDDMLLATFRDAFTAALDQRPATAGRSQAWLRDWLGTDM